MSNVINMGHVVCFISETRGTIPTSGEGWRLMVSHAGSMLRLPRTLKTKPKCASNWQHSTPPSHMMRPVLLPCVWCFSRTPPCVLLLLPGSSCTLPTNRLTKNSFQCILWEPASYGNRGGFGNHPHLQLVSDVRWSFGIVHAISEVGPKSSVTEISNAL